MQQRSECAVVLGVEEAYERTERLFVRLSHRQRVLVEFKGSTHQ